jgi:hypothetical protein
MKQQNFFEKEKKKPTLFDKQMILFALGEFQARGKVLAERELPLDRLRGALRRAAEVFEVEELSDEQAAKIFSSLGAIVKQVPTFVAKHPYRITVPNELAERALDSYRKRIEKAQKVSA